MKVVVWPADEQGSGNYRLVFPANALAVQGADIAVDRVGPVIEWSSSWEGLKTPPADCHVVRCRPYEADVVVMQRPGRMHWAELIPHLQLQGIRVVVDVDDLFDAIDRRNIAHHGYESLIVNHRYIDQCCEMADLVTCSTPALLKRYGYGKGVVLPNLVPESYLSVFGLKRPDTIGWSGFVGTHPGDLQATEGAVAEVVKDSEWTVHVIGGPASQVGKGFGLTAAKLGTSIEKQFNPKTGRFDLVTRTVSDDTFGEKLTCTGRVEFIDYAPAVAELEVGIVPLEPSPFNAAKSALKMSEMASLGVPVIASPTPDNLRLNRLGVGLIAESRGQWKRLLAKVMGDVDFRYDLAESGREVMATQTYEVHADRWWSAWTEKALVSA